MEQNTIYTNAEIRSYLSKAYVPTFRRSNEDHFYNYRNRKTMAVPLPIIKQHFNRSEVMAIFGGKGEFPDYMEMARLDHHINNYKNQNNETENK